MPDAVDELVRYRPVLWQKSHPDNKDTRRIKANNWEDMNTSLRESGATTTGTSFLYDMALLVDTA